MPPKIAFLSQNQLANSIQRGEEVCYTSSDNFYALFLEANIPSTSCCPPAYSAEYFFGFRPIYCSNTREKWLRLVKPNW